MKTFRLTFLIVITLNLSVPLIMAQETSLVLDKPGTFTMLSRTDYVMPDFGFTKAEVIANLQEINDVVAVVRKNQVLAGLNGFDAQARIFTISMKEPQNYGVPAGIKFEFSSYFKSKTGSVVNNKIEPPEWSITTNKLIPSFSNGFDTKHGYFSASLNKVTLAPGIDVYDGECYVIYDPSKPDYWLPVTVDEAFEAVRAFYKNQKDQESVSYLIEYVEKEYAEIPVADRNKPAYYGGNVSKVSSSPDYGDQKNLFSRIVKVNPEYWNKSLPKSSIQFMYFRMIGNRSFLQSRTREALQKNSTSYHLYLFEESLNVDFVKSLQPLICK